MSHVLCLVKSGQAKQYFQQNMTILAQPEGYTMTTRYKQRWVHHAVDAPLPSEAILFYSEPPYQHVLPIRTATLNEMTFDESDSSFVYTLTLGPLLTLPDFAQIDAYMRECRPDDSVVFTAPRPSLPTPGDSAHRRWNALVYHLTSPDYTSGHNPYTCALFSFVHPAQNNGHLTVGQTYYRAVSLLAPGLDSGAMEQVQVHSEHPVLNARVGLDGNIAAGQLRVSIQPLQALEQPWNVSLFFRPNGVASGPVHFPLPPIAAVNLASGERETYYRRQLFEWLAPKLEPADQLKLLDRFLLPQEPTPHPDAHLLLARATLLKQANDPSSAFETLQRIAADERTDEVYVLMVECALASQRRIAFGAMLDQITNWDNGQLGNRLVAALVQVSDEQEILTLAAHFCRLAPSYATRLWQVVGLVLRQPANRLAFIELLEQGSTVQPTGYLRLAPSDVFAYLIRGDSEPRRLGNDVLARVVAAGMAGSGVSGLAPYFMEWLERTLKQAGRSEVNAAVERFEQANGWLSTQQRERAILWLNDALKRVGEAEQALWTLLQRAEEARLVSDLETAERWLKEARNGISALSGDKRKEMNELVRQEDENISAARAAIASSFAPRQGNDPGLSAIFDLYEVDCAPPCWADLNHLLKVNPFVVQQLVERLEILNKFGQQAGTTNARIHSLTDIQGNVYRLELSDQARVIFKKMGRRIRLISLYATHDDYDAAIKKRIELINRLRT